MPEQLLIGKYHVLQTIASGGMGDVYKAYDPDIRREVALKTIKRELLSDPIFRERFKREAHGMGKLEHDNIIRLYNVEEDQEGIPFLVLEYFRGTNIGERLRSDTRLPLNQAIDITRQTAMALACAHAHGINHRDVKPANVLIGATGKVKLTDFGIAAILDEAPITLVNEFLGTLLYVSPEQRLTKALDPSSDLYSLGLMFYEMVTGSHPRRGLSKDQIKDMLAQETTYSLPSFPSSIPSEVQTIVTKLLQYDPVNRIQTAHELIEQLESSQSGGKPNKQKLLDPGGEPPTEFEGVSNSAPSANGKNSRTSTTNKPSKKSALPTWVTQATLVCGIAATIGIAVYTVIWPESKPFTAGPDTTTNTSVPQPPEVDKRLEDFTQSIMQIDLRTLNMISVMDPARRNWIENLFRDYKTIEASVHDVVTGPNKIKAVLHIDKLILVNGDQVAAGESLKNIELTIPREEDHWGKIHW